MLRSPFRFLSLVALLAIFITPVLAAEVPTAAVEPSVALQAVATPSPAAAVTTPQPLFLSTGSGTNPDGTCWASNSCDGGTPVTCDGTSICEVISSGVRCDGAVSTCPDRCTASTTCSCWCGATPSVFCSSNSGDCVETDLRITCNGQIQGCVMACYQVCGPRTPQWP